MASQEERRSGCCFIGRAEKGKLLTESEKKKKKCVTVENGEVALQKEKKRCCFTQRDGNKNCLAEREKAGRDILRHNTLKIEKVMSQKGGTEMHMFRP